jgi:4-amino-4-deoxy-L-arabinose transferase-like glycosyltransferase
VARALSAVLPVIAGSVLYVAMALSGIAQKSGTYDEYVHVTAGYSYWTFDDYRLDPENGNWSQRLVALPLVMENAGARAFPSLDQPAWHASDMWALSDDFFFAPGRNADALLFRARAVVAVVGALLGALVFAWARSLFGGPGAWTAFVLYVFSPTMLAHGALATSDMIGAAFFTAALWAMWTALHRATPWTLAVSVLATSGLFLAKPSAPVFIVIALAMSVVQLAGRRPVAWRWGRSRNITARPARACAVAAVVAAHAVGVFALIWASYGFRYSAFGTTAGAADTFLGSWSSILDTPGVVTSLAEWGRAHHILPEAYLYGLATVMAYSRDRISFLNGTVHMGGTPAFFPYAALVKTTIPGLLILAAIPVSLAAASRARRARRTPNAARTLYDLTPLLAAVLIYGAFTLTSSLNIGYRHLLPLIPAAMILAGAAGEAVFGSRRDGWPRGVARPQRADIGVARASWWPRGKRAFAAVGLVALLAWHAGESLWIAPNYLAYFNEIVGGPSQGYRHLVDSSLDWGQDLPTLKRWLDRNGLQGGNHPPVYLSYFGTALPSFYGIDARPLASFPDRAPVAEPTPLVPGVYCFSATMLQGLYFMTPGAWSARYESDYQSMLYNLKLYDSTATIPSAHVALLRQTGEVFWRKNFAAFEHLRTARLAAHLRRRAPDAEVGYSILIYRVGEQELSAALAGPPPP